MSVKFGTDGARAPYNGDSNAGPGFITPETGYRIGAAAVEVLGLDRWVIVQDSRTFNPELASAIKEGIASRGARTADLGILPTPAGAFVADWQTKNNGHVYGAFSVSASHNQATDAGIKLFGANGVKLDDTTTKQVEARANDLVISNNGLFYSEEPDTGGNTEDLRELYVHMLLRTVDKRLGKRFLTGKDIVIDAANGAAYWSAPEVMRRLGANVILINGDPKAEINKDCGATHINSMVEAVKLYGTTYGMSLDGDADRLIAFARTGNKERILDGDDALAIMFSGLVAQKQPYVPETVVTDYSTVGFKHEMDRRGIKVKFVDNGDRYVLQGLKETGAPAGGEKTGHTLYPYVSGKNNMVLSGDGTLAAMQELQAEALIGKPLTEVSDWPLLGYSRADLPVTPGVNTKALIASEDIAKVIESGSERVGVDGLVLVRGSGTEPLVRVLVKTEDQFLADYIVAEVKQALEGAM